MLVTLLLLAAVDVETGVPGDFPPAHTSVEPNTRTFSRSALSGTGELSWAQARLDLYLLIILISI